MGTGYPHQATLDGPRELTPGDTRVEFHDCVIDLLDRDTLDPGSTAPSRIYPLHPEYWRGVREGQRIGLYEGWRFIGGLDIRAGMSAGHLDAWLAAKEEREHPSDLQDRIRRIRRSVDAYRRRLPK
jgi:hypothetical protein